MTFAYLGQLAKEHPELWVRAPFVKVGTKEMAFPWYAEMTQVCLSLDL